MKERPVMMLVSLSAGALYECRLCGSPTALSGSCRGCGAPSVVEDRPMRRHARPPANWMLTLAHNLAVAGFGALMFKAGDTYGFHMGGDGSYDSNAEQCTCQWRPGTGEPYRPRSRCEHDNDDYEYDEPEVEFDDLDEYDPPAVAGPNGCTCGFNGDCNCRFVP